MKQTKLVVAGLLALATMLSACGKSNPDQSSDANATSSEVSTMVEDTPYEERQTINAEVGYAFTLPEWLTKYATELILHYADGTTLEIKSPYCLSAEEVKLGQHQISYTNLDGTSGSVGFHVVDSEAPYFGAFWTTYNPESDYPYFLPQGDTVDLRETFRAKDNSGVAPHLTFKVYHNDVEPVTLTGEDGTMLALENGYYRVYATATDDAGNSTARSLKIQLSTSVASLTTNYGADVAMRPNGSRGFGWFEIPHEGSWAVGDYYEVSFDYLVTDDTSYDISIKGSISGVEFASSSDSSWSRSSWCTANVTAKVVAKGTALTPRYLEAVAPEDGLYFFFEGISSGDVVLYKNITLTKK